MLNDIDFDVGNIAYNEFHIDFDKTLCEQEDSLTEDLLQVEYPNNYLIDLGWYPECNSNGNFIISVIYDFDWEKPVLKKIVACNQELVRDTLLVAINIVKGLLKETQDKK